ncbi:F-box protein [Gossypium australe]|uniref:F-box protein n=1 Tax=Gossypium australe TaxID=47621 RepID=A0A5B6X935_9ROSI|nr:F-box protein [Gossypium australe]
MSCAVVLVPKYESFSLCHNFHQHVDNFYISRIFMANHTEKNPMSPVDSVCLLIWNLSAVWGWNGCSTLFFIPTELKCPTSRLTSALISYPFSINIKKKEKDTVVLEFNQYTAGSRWRRATINRKEHREEGNEADGFYGGIRKLCNEEEISTWKRLWPSEILE